MNVHPSSSRRRLPPGARVACAAAVLTGAFGFANAGASFEKPLNPCTFVSNNDVLHLLGWTVDGREKRPYDLHGGTGAMCFISSSQGQVIVIVPDPGTAYPGIDPDSDPSATGLVRHVTEFGANVTLYNGTVYVTKTHRNVAVRVVPQDHMASYAEVEGFAKVVAHHLH
jgi:hypothetical protein